MIADFDADGVPLAVSLSAGRIPQIVLLGQLVGDPCRCRIQIAGVANDLRPTAAVVGEIAECCTVDRVPAALESWRPEGRSGPLGGVGNRVGNAFAWAVAWATN